MFTILGMVFYFISIVLYLIFVNTNGFYMNQNMVWLVLLSVISSIAFAFIECSVFTLFLLHFHISNTNLSAYLCAGSQMNVLLSLLPLLSAFGLFLVNSYTLVANNFFRLYIGEVMAFPGAIWTIAAVGIWKWRTEMVTK